MPATFYRTGATLATALTTAMNTATCTPARTPGFNVYAVTYASATGVFTFNRTAAGTRTFQSRWPDNPNSIRGALNRVAAGNTGIVITFASGNSFTRTFRDTSGTW